MRSPNFLILDEPTNDLDILTLNVLEEYLLSFNGCVVVVTHDRYFLDKIADHLFVFQGGGRIKDFPGNYSQYREWSDEQKRKEQLVRKIAARAEEPTVQPQANKSRVGLTFREKRELDMLEKEIGKLEATKEEIETSLSSGTLSSEELVTSAERYRELLDEISSKSDRWLELSEKESKV
jgi:ATP-binding cassette subfamily F protein uup